MRHHPHGVFTIKGNQMTAPGSGSDPYLTAAEVAERLRVTPMWVADLCRTGKLPATQPFRQWLIKESELQAYLDAHSNQTATA